MERGEEFQSIVFLLIVLKEELRQRDQISSTFYIQRDVNSSK